MRELTAPTCALAIGGDVDHRLNDGEGAFRLGDVGDEAAVDLGADDLWKKAASAER